MSHPEIERSKEPLRLFKSDLLEAFTHIHPAVVAAIWLPVVLFFLGRAVWQRPLGASPLYIPAVFLLGLFLWTLAEYGLHRFVFHHKAHTPWGQRFFFLLHGVHHAQPRIKTRLVMPPQISLLLAAPFYGLFALVVGRLLAAPHVVAPLFAGFIAGYLLYDMTHYSIHHVAIPGGYFRTIRSHHMRHHGQSMAMRFGVTNVWWDRLLGTMPAEG